MSEAKKILLIGGGGHCISVLDSLLSSYNYEEIGIVDKRPTMMGKTDSIADQYTIMGIPIVGSDDDLKKLYADGYTHAFITVGSVGDVTIRKELYELVKSFGFYIPNIIDKTGIVSSYAICGEGIFVGKKAVINAGSKIGNCAIINTASVIEHECTIGDFVHVAPGSIVCGKVHVGNESHIGAGTIIKQGIEIGTETMIGAGSVVVKNIVSYVTAYGNPCKEMLKR
ncbi:acetyltransferase [Anaerocolumna aminovalerica]|jgi:sugar O-acyltransferase (sialic acid O-acetyltransferase NeuD family)|uniref:Sugar O-acyltransferase, sialic acid O-acetyltransferase NeuD family n=1 Tax=Anaerocolumna aminovalerica TaxID=1527 RepID=A0A1I5DM11_9FIRM|nr:acetyltransferase [Anaerocolumna aminovalerica]MBU5332234.1 acetyltransferase [Anaerocolumna aminovalerica]MDU6263938.1 acetyltransferase [Anaerocolumna aminovalerica]SFO00262.1 sugar O-acyltransferase, sialic acid O-acetyltransferase NeuD family [Anaerocolumna aminovalerica]